jgi:hypothetical protein
MIFKLKSITFAAGALTVAASITQAAPRIFPSAVGSQWRYQVSNGTAYSDKIIAASKRGFTVLYNGATTYRMHWMLSSAGWTTPNFKALGAVHTLGESFKTHVTGSGGVVVPHTAFWKQGYRWSFWYSMRTTGSTGPMTFTQTGKMLVDNKIVGMKTVRVPDGRFHCFVVQSQLIFTGTEAVAGQTIPLHVATAETQYYSLGTGLIKRTDGKTTTVLTKFVPGR